MRKLLMLTTLGLVLGACQGASREQAAVPPPGVDVAATWRGGWIATADLEAAVAQARTPACRKMRRAAAGGSLEELLACYRESAEGLALEGIVLAGVDVDAAVSALLAEQPRLRRAAYFTAWKRRALEVVEVSDAELVAYYEAHRDRFRRPAQMTVWDIFRRHEDGAGPEATEAFLRGLKARYEAGETFDALAREYSQSETRLRGGLVGRLSEGRLPKRLEEVALALADGEVSEPVRVRGGAVLLHVTGVSESAEFSLAEVRPKARQLLRAEKVAERLRERAAGVELPKDSLILSTPDLLAALDEASPDEGGESEGRDVLVIGDEAISAGEMRRLVGLKPAVRATALDEDRRQRIAEAYEGQIEQMLVLADLLSSADAADAELRREAEERLRAEAVSRVVDQRVREEIWRLVDADPEKLKTFYEDNQPHYQSELRFRLRSWDVLFGPDPPRQLRRMEELRRALAAGETDLDAAVAELGGEVRDLGTRTLEELADEIPPKAREYLLQVDASGFSVPYQQDEALHLLCVDERLEPRRLRYEEVRDRLRNDYYERFSRDLYRQVADARLAAAGYLFDEEEVRAWLAPPGG